VTHYVTHIVGISLREGTILVPVRFWTTTGTGTQTYRGREMSGVDWARIPLLNMISPESIFIIPMYRTELHCMSVYNNSSHNCQLLQESGQQALVKKPFQYRCRQAAVIAFERQSFVIAEERVDASDHRSRLDLSPPRLSAGGTTGTKGCLRGCGSRLTRRDSTHV